MAKSAVARRRPGAAPVAAALAGAALRMRLRAPARNLLCVALSATFALGVPWQQAMAQNADQANLNFVGADIESVIKAVGQYANVTFVIDPRIKGTINLVSEKPVTKTQAFQLLVAALRLQGFAAVTAGGITKVVPEADAKLQAAPVTAGTSGDPGSLRGDQIATQIFRLNYESAPNLVAVLRPLISPNNTISANPANNTLVITDYADNLRRMGRIIASLDGPSTADLDVIPIRYALATDIAGMVNRLLETGGGLGAVNQGGGAAAGGAGGTSLLADTRTNSVIVRAPSSARANLAKSLIAKLDQPTAMPGNVHVVYLKNAEATKLAATLRAVVASDSSSASQSSTGSQNQQSNNQISQSFQNNSGNSGQTSLPSLTPNQPTTLSTGGPGGFIQADAATNTLIITASEAVYRNMRVIIDQLDARRAQVYIESLIVEITSEKAAELGVQWAGLSGDSNSNYRVGALTSFSSGGSNLVSLATGISAASAGTATADTVLPSAGLNLGVFRQIAGKIGLGALARALESDGNANILSMPNLITLDNEEATIIVGQNVPFVTGQYQTQSTSAAVNPFQTIERKDIGLSLRVRPQISEGGTVKMAIYQETSSLAPTGSARDLVTNKRSIQTNVLVEDGEMLVLGGLIEDNGRDSMEQVPGLGNLPVVGNLFKYRNRSRAKTNLMVFLRPTVVRSAAQSVSITGDRYDYIRNQQMLAPQVPIPLQRQDAPAQMPMIENGRPSGGGMLSVPPETRPQTMFNGAAGSLLPVGQGGQGAYGNYGNTGGSGGYAPASAQDVPTLQNAPGAPGAPGLPMTPSAPASLPPPVMPTLPLTPAQAPQTLSN